MSSKSKNSTSLLYLAAVGMCLGLVFAGPSSQSFAQAPESHPSERNKDREKKRDGETALEVFAASLEDLYRISTEITSEAKGERNAGFSFGYYVTIKPNGVSSQTSFGNDSSPWSGKLREPLRNLYDAFLPRADDWNENFLVQFNVDKDRVTLKTTIISDPDTVPASLAAFEQSLVRKKAGEANFVRSQIYEAANITVEKNKIIVVANLPRAGLESLLTRNEQ